MYILLLVIHVIVCFVLIAVVLLQAGRGGGFSEMMGGSQPSSIFGTQTSEFMTRATEVCAVIFIITSLSLGILSTQRGKSLMEKRMFSDVTKKAVSDKTVPANAKDDIAKAVADLKANTKTDVDKAVDTAATETQKALNAVADKTQETAANVAKTAEVAVSEAAAQDAAKKS